MSAALSIIERRCLLRQNDPNLVELRKQENDLL